MQEILCLEINVVFMNGYWAILNKDLLVIGSLSQRSVDAALSNQIATNNELSIKEWVAWSRKQPEILGRRPLDEWSKKIDSWLSSINKRRAPTERAKSSYKTDDWATCCSRMKYKANAKRRRNERIDSDAWCLWCESSGSNLAKRSKEKANSRIRSTTKAS